MLERASACLESGGRQLLRAPKSALHTRRKLHSTFWHHGASDLSLPLWWAINPANSASGVEQPAATASTAANSAPLDFLYPEQTLVLLRRFSANIEAAHGSRTATRGYATARANVVDPSLEEEVDAALAKEAKREVHERLLHASAHDALSNLLRRDEAGKQEVAWQLYMALTTPLSAALLVRLLAYLTADNEPAVPARVLKLFDQLPEEDRTAGSYRAAIIACVALRDIAHAIQLHRTAAHQGRFVHHEGHVPDIGTDVLLRRLVNDEQWDVAMRVYSTYVVEARYSIDRKRTTSRIRWGQATLPEIWHDAVQLPEIKEHLQSLLLHIRRFKEDLTATKRRQEMLYTFVQSFVANVMERVLYVRKPNENEIWDWFTKLFDDLHAMELPVDASYDHAIKAMLSVEKYRKYTNQRKLPLELYRRYRQWYLYERVEEPGWKTYPPQLPMLSLVLNAHASHGSLDRVNDLVTDVRTFYPGRSLSQPMLQALMQVYAEHGRVNLVEQYFDELRESYGDQVTHKQADPLLYVHARRADVQGVWAAFQRIREDLNLTPDTRMWNNLLLTFVRADDLDGALETFNNALDAGMEPDIYTFGPMLDMCANRGDIEAFEALYSRAKQMGVPIDQDVRARSGYVQVFVNAEDIEAAENIAQGMLTQWKAGVLKGHPLTHTWNIMIQHYALRGDVANSRRLYREMIDNKIPLDGITFCGLMRSLVEIKQTNAAYKILRVTLPEHNLRVEAIHYSIVMTGFLKEGQYDLALEAYERMEERNVTPTVSSRQASIVTVGMSELARLMEKPKYTPNHPGNPNLKLKHVEKLLRTMLQSGDVGEDVAHRQPTHNRYIDSQTHSAVPASYYGLLITLYNTRGAYKICKQLFTKAEATMDPNDFDAPTTFLTAIMEAHYNAKEWDEVEKCWEQVRESSTKLIKTFQQVMNPAPALTGSPSLTDDEVLQRFEESRIAINRRQVLTKATRIYIRSLINRHKGQFMSQALLQKAQTTMRDLLVSGFVVDHFTWNELIVALAQHGQFVNAFAIAEKYLMPRFPGWRHLAPYYVRQDRKGYQWMELRHFEVKRNTVLPRYKTLVVLAKAMAMVKENERNGIGYVEREARWAREVLEEKAPRVCTAIETMPITRDPVQEQYFVGGIMGRKNEKKEKGRGEKGRQ